MTFWTYMLHCRGGYFYTGHTDDLEARLASHQAGDCGGFTADHLPVELVWSETFATRDEAKAAERRLKGWSRAKKMALIRSDWDEISRLAKGKNSPSTSSGRTGLSEVQEPRNSARPEPVEGPQFNLLAHTSSLPQAVDQVSVHVQRQVQGLALTYWLSGHLADLVIPAPVNPVRTDELWRSTCFELFVRGEGLAYQEFNFSPSGEWAAYAFDSYRSETRPLDLPDLPTIEAEIVSDNHLVVRVALAAQLMEDTRIGLSAVIEELDGNKSYWALAHPEGPPDFHHDACFAATLPAIAQQ